MDGCWTQRDCRIYGQELLVDTVLYAYENCQLVPDSLPVLDLPIVLLNLRYMGCPLLLTRSFWIKIAQNEKTY